MKNQNNETIGKLIILNNEIIKDRIKKFDKTNYKDQTNFETIPTNGNICARIPSIINKNNNINYFNNEIENKNKKIIKEENEKKNEKIIIQ